MDNLNKKFLSATNQKNKEDDRSSSKDKQKSDKNGKKSDNRNSENSR